MDNDDLAAAFHTALSTLGEGRLSVDACFEEYAGLKSSVSIRGGRVRARVSDGFKHADYPVLVGLALDLLSRALRKSVSEENASFVRSYREFSSRESVADLHNVMRRTRGRERSGVSEGECYDLAREAGDLVSEYAGVFEGVKIPRAAWSRERSRSQLGLHDPAFDEVVINRALDSARVPRFVLRYVLFHELLHAKHDVLYQRGKSLRRTVHPKAFKQDERKFLEYEQAAEWLKNRL
jgi:hypothetical protein